MNSVGWIRVPRRGTRMGIAVALSAVVVATSGCGAGLEQVPLPAPGVGGQTYELTATFANALNLPDKAKVRAAGADVGEVTAMKAENFRAIVTLKIKSSSIFAVGTVAQLRSATPLGDVFVALIPPKNALSNGPILRHRDAIGIADTSSAATVEEVLTTSSLLVNGGAIRNLTKIVNGLGDAVGEGGTGAAELINETTRVISGLSARSGDIADIVAATDELSATLAGQRGALAESLDAAGPALGVVSANTSQILDLVSAVDRISAQISRFPSVAGTDYRSTIADLNRLSDYFNRAALNPNADLDAVNGLLAPLIKATSSTSAHANINVAAVAVGVVGDPNHKADPGMRVPDLTDAARMVGSLTYLFERLHDRVVGGG